LSKTQWIVLACLGTAVVVVFACLGSLLLGDWTQRLPSQVHIELQPFDEVTQSPVARPTPHATPTATRVRPTSTPRPPQYELALISMRGSSSYGYFIVEGQVKNISGSSLDNVLAVVTVYDANKAFITYDEALIDYTPILAGQTSPFTVYVDYNPAIEWYEVEFKYLLGGTIPYRDDTD
jgi:hypothetical protein